MAFVKSGSDFLLLCLCYSVTYLTVKYSNQITREWITFSNRPQNLRRLDWASERARAFKQSVHENGAERAAKQINTSPAREQRES